MGFIWYSMGLRHIGDLVKLVLLNQKMGFVQLSVQSLQMVTAAMKFKDAYSLEGKLWPT